MKFKDLFKKKTTEPESSLFDKLVRMLNHVSSTSNLDNFLKAHESDIQSLNSDESYQFLQYLYNNEKDLIKKWTRSTSV